MKVIVKSHLRKGRKVRSHSRTNSKIGKSYSLPSKGSAAARFKNEREREKKRSELNTKTRSTIYAYPNVYDKGTQAHPKTGAVRSAISATDAHLARTRKRTAAFHDSHTLFGTSKKGGKKPKSSFQYGLMKVNLHNHLKGVKYNK